MAAPSRSLLFDRDLHAVPPTVALNPVLIIDELFDVFHMKNFSELYRILRNGFSKQSSSVTCDADKECPALTLGVLE